MQVNSPKTKKEVRAFLGMVGYYRKFVANFATIAKPLTDLTKKGESTTVSWSNEATTAFETLKQVMSQYPVLRLPQFDKTFILTTDASQMGLGAVIMQEHDGMKMPVIYISRKLKDAETRFSTIGR